jgi:hypothetical protein
LPLSITLFAHQAEVDKPALRLHHTGHRRRYRPRPDVVGDKQERHLIDQRGVQFTGRFIHLRRGKGVLHRRRQLFRLRRRK